MGHSAACTVAIVGTGPYGLSLAAHLEAAGVDYRIFGKPMELWRSHMPKGMMLKSDGFASSLSAPVSGARLEDYCSAHHIPYAAQGFPVPVGDFVDYADWFRRKFVHRLDTRMVEHLARTADGYALTLEGGEAVAAEQVVLAVGITAFPVIPPEFHGVPPHLVSHSYNHRTVEQFAGRKVIVMGAGASAVNLAYELELVNSDVSLLVRRDHVEYHQPPGRKPRTLLQRLRHPSSPVGPGWRSWFCATFPGLFYRLSRAVRERGVRIHMRPAAGWFMRDRVKDKVRVLLQRRIREVAVAGEGLTLHLSDGTQETCDHVICATGYDIDVRRLGFLDPHIAAAIVNPGQKSFVGPDFQTSLPGLYAVGPMAMENFGPLLRFVAGVEYACPRLTAILARRIRLQGWQRRLKALLRPVAEAATQQA
jgi:cation diffusion facilitator CzcD-associated flavoprotein CzcO